MLRIVLFCSIVGALLCGACSPTNTLPSEYDDSEASQDLYIDPSSEQSISIKELRGYYTGQTTLLTDDIVIDGVVMVNDAFGELYKSFIIEDGTAAVKIMCDISNVYDRFSVGSQVSVRCSSLWLGASGASIHLGYKPTSVYAVDYIDEEDVDIYITVTSTELIYPSLPVVTISELSDEMSLRSVVFNNMTFASASSVTHYVMSDESTSESVATYHTLSDPEGNEIELYVSPYVSYASQRVPSGEVSLGVVVERYGSDYSLMIVNASVKE
ncbi:MAG: DUF5689 domain-containing protein [Rikenellaceae bacterium]